MTALLIILCVLIGLGAAALLLIRRFESMPSKKKKKLFTKTINEVYTWFEDHGLMRRNPAYIRDYHREYPELKVLEDNHAVVQRECLELLNIKDRLTDVRALGAGGRLLGIHSCGNDPGLEIVQEVWPGEQPFVTSRHDVLRAVKHELGKDARRYNFNAYADNRAVFRYDMHTLPSEVSSAIGTSTLFAAWNAAVYVAQIDDERLAQVIGQRRYLDATAEVLKRHGSLWFLDESYVVSRKRE